ncbi:hypothetical protein G7Y79_00069g096590 [Physcia stellaris]|nr:hypothetical protein G7Y79_00069g096590 [Physcia stellaris]
MRFLTSILLPATALALALPPTTFPTSGSVSTTAPSLNAIDIPVVGLEKRGCHGFWSCLFYIPPGGGLHSRDLSASFPVTEDLEKRGCKGFWSCLFYIPPGGGLHSRDLSALLPISEDLEKRGCHGFWSCLFYIPPGGGLHSRDLSVPFAISQDLEKRGCHGFWGCLAWIPAKALTLVHPQGS